MIEQQLASQQLFVQAFQYAPIGMALIATNGRVLTANATFCSMLGFSVEELSHMTVQDITHPLDIHTDLELIHKLIEGKLASYQLEKRLLQKNGDYIWTESTTSTIPDLETGEVKEIIVVSRDITEQIINIRNLQHNEQHYKSIFDYHPDLIYSMDLDGYYTSINHSVEELMGYTKQEIIEKPLNFRSLLDPTNLKLVEYHFNQAKKGIAQRYEALAYNRDGIHLTFDVTNIPIFVNQQVTGVYGVARDISYQKALWKKLSDSQELYQIISENAQDIISYATADSIIRYVSPAIKTLLGYEPEEFVGKVSTDIWHPEDIASLGENCILQNSDVDIFVCRMLHKQGHYVWFETTAKVIRDENGDILKILTVGRDITARKQAEIELKSAHDHLESFIERNVDPILIINSEEKVIRSNLAFEKTFGWTDSEIIGLHVLDLPNIPYNLKSDALRNIVKIKSNGFLEELETVRKRKDDVMLTVSLSIFTMRDESGQINGWAVIYRDITDKKQTEELMIKSEKLSIAGQLAAGIAHEIRNPITAIKGFVQLMKSGGVEKKMYYEIMTSEIERIEMILSELLILAKPQMINVECSDIRQLLAQVITLLDTQAIINNVQIITEFDPDITHIQCDENQLKQVCINFIKNAIEAMPRGGKMVIQLTKKDPHTLLLRFIDDGCGIPKSLLAKLGQPFQTTKENGTGLGFMLSKRIIENHNGMVAVFSEENKGTTIEISLPFTH